MFYKMINYELMTLIVTTQQHLVQMLIVFVSECLRSQSIYKQK